jgi:hypothetical protein
LVGIVAEFLADGEPGFVRFGAAEPLDDAGSVTYAPLAVWAYDVTGQPGP